MQTEVTLKDDEKIVLISSGDPPFRIQFQVKDENLYSLLKMVSKDKRLETIVTRAGYELLGVHPEIEVGSHDYERYYKIQKKDIVIDAGAHVGIWTEIYSNAVGPEGIVIAIEPDYRALGYLVQNNYHRKNVIVVPYGLWNELDYMPFGIDAGLGTSSYLNWVTENNKSRLIEENIKLNYQLTKVDALDHILRDLNISKVDFVKMDIEGAEFRALKGMIETLKSVKALAIATYHKTMESPTSTTLEVSNFLKDAGFDVKVEFSKGEIVYANRSE